MKKLAADEAGSLLALVRREIRRSHDSRYYHRLHGLLLVGGGCSCAEAAALLHEDPRTVQRWVRRFERHGLAGLREGERTGRPRSLSPEQWRLLEEQVRRPPRECGLEGARWDARLLMEFLQLSFDRPFSVRHCQRILRQLESS